MLHNTLSEATSLKEFREIILYPPLPPPPPACECPADPGNNPLTQKMYPTKPQEIYLEEVLRH